MDRARRAASESAEKFGHGSPGMAPTWTLALGPCCGDFPYARITNAPNTLLKNKATHAPVSSSNP